MVDPELDYYAYSYQDSYYNQPQRDDNYIQQNAKLKGKARGLLQQFRRR